MRETMLFCSGWEFSLCPVGTDQKAAVNWQAVDLPHDWMIGDTHDLYKTSTGWYRRRFTVPADGRRTYIRFEGVYMDCRVYVNGKRAGEWKYGYTTFGFDITDLLSEGENELSVSVDYRNCNTRWYSGAGIYRKVWLERFEQERILPDGVYISADVSGKVLVTAEAARPLDETAENLTVSAEIYRNGELIAERTDRVCAADRSAFEPEIVSESFSYSSNTLTLFVDNPAVWDVDDPQLYTCKVTLYRSGEAVDTVSTRFGFRSIAFDTDKGFFLNGRQLKLHGCCMHHDLGALGSASNRSAIRRQLTKIRKMGINAVRTSHNPPAVDFLELADEMGFLILDEAFDMWERCKTEYDYGRFFPEWKEKDVASWIRRDRNHPCIFGWSIGNEIYDTHVSERGQEVTSLLLSLVRRHDPRANAFVTIGSNYMGGDNAQRCADILKIAGYNYSENLYDQHHAEHPDWCIYGSETSSVVSSRGIYHFPLSKAILCEDDRQCSALGNSAPAWASRSIERCIIADRDREFCAGQFFWTGFDYIGEPTPYSTKNSYFGQIDTAGFPKDGAFIYKSAWVDFEKEPFVHIFPYWDHSEGELIDIRVASNAPKVKLWFNGELIAEKDFDRRTCKELTLDTVLPYSRGELRAAACDADGKELAVDVRRSFGDAVKLRLTPDREEIPAGSEELIFIEIDALDKDGNTVDNANNRVFINVEGAGRLVGMDNGDSTDYEQYKATSRRMFSGKLLAVIAPIGESGSIRVTASSPSLPDCLSELRAVPAERVEGISFLAANTERPCDCKDPASDIPIRRIGLSGELKRFSPEHKELSFRTTVFPANTSYPDDIEYRITTVDGISSNLAEIVSSDPQSVTVRCLGDGEFFLRALTRNGTNDIRLYSQIRLTAEGVGKACIDPYELVTGGLYTIGENCSNGIMHGAAFGVGGGWFGYENVDFGPLGSDTVTLPIFANYATPVRIEVWDGIPGKGELLGDFEYNVKTVWMTYQPMTYKLSKTLRGAHTISFRSGWRYDVKGFVFERPCKETAELSAASAENIYGDKFTVEAEAVTGIGNNVSLDFGEFDFTEKQPKRIVIKGRSKLAANSIHIQLDGEERSRAALEFEGCEDYTERAFDLSGVSGKVRMTMIFLPGSEFDLYSVRFEC